MRSGDDQSDLVGWNVLGRRRSGEANVVATTLGFGPDRYQCACYAQRLSTERVNV